MDVEMNVTYDTCMAIVRVKCRRIVGASQIR